LEIQLWCVDLDHAPPAAALAPQLSPEEQQRAASFRGPLLQQRYVAAHAALRVTLARSLDLAPQALRLHADENGKPHVADAPALRFNLAHSGGLALIAVGRDSAELGVDVEQLRPLPDAADIAALSFSAGEIAGFAAAPEAERQRRFFRTWTRKEAYAKGRGLGLLLDLRRFCTAAPASVAVDHELDDGHSWRLLDLDPAPGYVGTLACMADSVTVVSQWFEYPPV